MSFKSVKTVTAIALSMAVMEAPRVTALPRRIPKQCHILYEAIPELHKLEVSKAEC
jgi:hypothetical protein